MADRQNIIQTYTVTASLTDDQETVIATLVGASSLFAGQSFKLHGWCALTADATAASLVLKIRRTSLSGTAVATSPTFTGVDITTPTLVGFDVYGIDSRADVASATYVMTATMASATGPATVAAVFLEARVD